MILFQLQIPKRYEEQNPYVPSYETKAIENPVDRPRPSKGDDTIQACLYENILQEYSTLGFLMAGKNFPDQELVFNDAKPSALKSMFYLVTYKELIVKIQGISIRIHLIRTVTCLDNEPCHGQHPDPGTFLHLSWISRISLVHLCKSKPSISLQSFSPFFLSLLPFILSFLR